MDGRPAKTILDELKETLTDWPMLLLFAILIVVFYIVIPHIATVLYYEHVAGEKIASDDFYKNNSVSMLRLVGVDEPECEHAPYIVKYSFDCANGTRMTATVNVFDDESVGPIVYEVTW